MVSDETLYKTTYIFQQQQHYTPVPFFTGRTGSTIGTKLFAIRRQSTTMIGRLRLTILSSIFAIGKVIGRRTVALLKFIPFHTQCFQTRRSMKTMRGTTSFSFD